MTLLLTIIISLITAAIGGVVGFLVSRVRSNQERETLLLERTTLETKLSEQERLAKELGSFADRSQEQLEILFRSLSQQSLQENNRTFLETAKLTFEKLQQGSTQELEKRKQAIEELVKPIKETIEKVDSKIVEFDKNRDATFASVTEQMKALASTESQLKTETANLVKALRAPQTRGRWGEMQLKRVVEMAGMIEYCDFVTQESADTENGKLRPDMIIRMPSGRQVVVDAKTPLMAYLEALEAPDEETRVRRLDEHARQVRTQLNLLSQKSYSSQFERSPDFVILFLPGETFFSAALERDPGLIEFGVSNSVLVASPTTLIALLRSVAYGWNQEQLAENAQKISDLGKKLHERLGVFGSYIHGIRSGLNAAVNSYNAAVGSFESRVLVSAREFDELGASSGRALPELEVISEPLRAPNLPESGAKLLD